MAFQEKKTNIIWVTTFGLCLFVWGHKARSLPWFVWLKKKRIQDLCGAFSVLFVNVHLCAGSFYSSF